MQADVAQGGSGLWVVVVCDRTWAFAPLPRPEVQVEVEPLLLTLPEEARVQASAGGLCSRGNEYRCGQSGALALPRGI